MKHAYQRVGSDLYTCVAPVGFEKDPAVTKAIREFDPSAIPLWRVRRWRFPDATERNVVHHAIGRYFPWPRYLRGRPLRVEVPMDWRGEVPNFLDHVFEIEGLEYKRGGPGAYLPWDWDIYAWCRFQYDKSTAGAWLRRTTAKQERLAREHQSLMDEMEYRKRQIEPFLMKKAGELTELDWKQYLEAVYGKNKGKVALRTKKPFADLGAGRPGAEHLERVAPAKGVA